MKSLWMEVQKEILDKQQELKEDIETEICIVGGGITGITTAYYLSKAGKRVIVLESDKIAEKTTGNTTAKITSQHDLFYKYLIENFGKDYAAKYYNANQQAIENIQEIIEKEKIECDFERQNAYVFTTEEKQIQKIKDEVKAVKEIGGEAEFVEKIDSPIQNVIGAIKFPNQAMFNPRKYIKGLVNKILENNGKIYENSKVYSVKKELDGYRIYTKEAEVKAKYVVIATHYPVINFPGFYFLKMYQDMSYAIGIETKDRLFQGMYISVEEPKISLRTAKDGDKEIVILGGMGHRVGAKIDLQNAYEYLEKVAKELYGDAKVLYKWETQDCITLDKIPYVGEYSNLMKNIYVATGYKKWGMTTSNIAANIITNKILDKDYEYENIFVSTRLHPIKNRWEFGEMIKESANSLVINKFKESEEEIQEVGIDEGKIVEIKGEKVGVYKDKTGKIYKIKPICSHLGCELSWNNLEKTWDCPCHGSRFDYQGNQIYGPAIKDLEIKLE